MFSNLNLLARLVLIIWTGRDMSYELLITMVQHNTYLKRQQASKALLPRKTQLLMQFCQRAGAFFSFCKRKSLMIKRFFFRNLGLTFYF